VIIEVLDARDPLGCRCPQVEDAVLTSGKNKKLILLLNKIGTGTVDVFHCARNLMAFICLDLIPRDNLDRWLKYLRNEFPTIAFRASTQTQRDRLVRMKEDRPVSLLCLTRHSD
jgi:nuclear GTP-binding protein